ncbi:hypothetical protein D9758_007570 [Tetrapyrgos nigripes]|uniref:Cytochrome P450 n=1 Tax=Tetrapyrgos nigripes TaxID=182062 RepID=A0A8H5LJQ8_9AGAR|nr:hypothetical protein D9758_007570 [Tetrapyrgos nigripes]
MENSAKTTLKALKDGPFEVAMKAWASGSSSSLVGQLVSEAKNRYPDEGNSEYLAEIESIKSMGFTALAAASDTTVSATTTFFIAMSLYPQVQKKAQAELDRVLGFGRLPGFGDRTSLPYIEAIYKEVMRWYPAIPIGLVHKTTEDIFYKGYYIPKGSGISANIWAMGHNPAEHENPDEFIPERHLQDNGLGEPELKSGFGNVSNILAYGFGRRVCVGRYFADATLWLTMACVLATMNISRDSINSTNESVSDEDLKKNLEDYYTDCSLSHLKELPGVKVLPRLSKEELEGLFDQDKEI